MEDKKIDLEIREKDFLEKLRGVYETLRKKMNEEWQRDLPLEELLFDRWERASSLGFGSGSSIYHNSYVFGDVRVGDHTWIGPFTVLDGTGGLCIGSYCSVSSGVQIYSHDTIQWAVTGGNAPYEYAPVRIGDRCYLGPYAVVAKGVSIGDGSIIGAHSLVLSDVPAGSKAMGCPARVI